MRTALISMNLILVAFLRAPSASTDCGVPAQPPTEARAQGSSLQAEKALAERDAIRAADRTCYISWRERIQDYAFDCQQVGCLYRADLPTYRSAAECQPRNGSGWNCVASTECSGSLHCVRPGPEGGIPGDL